MAPHVPTRRLLVVLALLATPSAAQTPEGAEASAPCPTPWTQVSLVAHKGPMKARVDLSVAPGSTTDLVACPAADGRNPSGPCVFVLEASTDAPFSAPVRTRTWIDPTLGVLQVEVWDGKVHRRSRECVSGRHSWRWERKGKQGEQFIRERHRDAPAGGSDLAVVDATSLVWLASAHHMEREGQVMQAAAWSKTGLLPLKLSAKERAVLPGPTAAGFAARRVEIGVDDDEDGDDSSSSSAAPFGMRGPVSLWLEEGTGMPLVLEGKCAKVGNIRAINAAYGVR